MAERKTPTPTDQRQDSEARARMEWEGYPIASDTTYPTRPGIRGRADGGQTTETIIEGNILIREDTELPVGVRLVCAPFVRGWKLVKNLDGYGLGREIREARWTFFSQAGDTKAITLGIHQQKTVRRAVGRILVTLKSEKFNSLEITRITSERFLGIPYVSVSARSRHIQEGVVLFQPKDRGMVRDRKQRTAA